MRHAPFLVLAGIAGTAGGGRSASDLCRPLHVRAGWLSHLPHSGHRADARKERCSPSAKGAGTAAATAGDIDVLVKRSADGGRTWSKAITGRRFRAGHHRQPGAGRRPPHQNRLAAVDAQPGRRARKDRFSPGISGPTRTVWVTHSKDDGLTWAAPADITAAVKQPDWTWYATGSGQRHSASHRPHGDSLRPRAAATSPALLPRDLQRRWRQDVETRRQRRPGLQRIDRGRAGRRLADAQHAQLRGQEPPRGIRSAATAASPGPSRRSTTP